VPGTRPFGRLARRLACVAAALGVWLGSTGCGAPPATHTVTIEGLRFQPEVLTVNAGDTVVWVNKDLFVHTATSKGVFDSRDLASGASWSYTPGEAGAFAYVCTYHPTMKATLVVR
jgi:plastocyanin